MNFSIQRWSDVIEFVSKCTDLRCLGGPLVHLVMEYCRRRHGELIMLRDNLLSRLINEFKLPFCLPCGWLKVATEDHVLVLKLVRHMLETHTKHYHRQRLQQARLAEEKWRTNLRDQREALRQKPKAVKGRVSRIRSLIQDKKPVFIPDPDQNETPALSLIRSQAHWVMIDFRDAQERGMPLFLQSLPPAHDKTGVVVVLNPQPSTAFEQHLKRLPDLIDCCKEEQQVLDAETRELSFLRPRLERLLNVQHIRHGWTYDEDPAEDLPFPWSVDLYRRLLHQPSKYDQLPYDVIEAHYNIRFVEEKKDSDPSVDFDGIGFIRIGQRTTDDELIAFILANHVSINSTTQHISGGYMKLNALADRLEQTCRNLNVDQRLFQWDLKTERVCEISMALERLLKHRSELLDPLTWDPNLQLLVKLTEGSDFHAQFHIHDDTLVIPSDFAVDEFLPRLRSLAPQMFGSQPEP